MDRETLLKLLEQAERHITLGERHIAKQRAIVAELSRDGHATAQAVELLATFEQSQRLHIEDRDRLRRELHEATHER